MFNAYTTQEEGYGTLGQDVYPIHSIGGGGMAHGVNTFNAYISQEEGA